MALVSCARIGDALAEWLDTASQLKKAQLCEALGCGPTNEEIAAAISVAVTAIFEGGTAGQVWTKFDDGTQGWQDLPEEPECFVETISDTGNLVASDNGKLVVGTGGTKTALNTLPVGFRVDLVGPVTVAVGGGASLRSADGATQVIEDAGATLIKISTSTFWLAGALE